MKYHDYSLEGYSVRDHGASLVLHLALGCETSEIEFSGVVLYHFVHTGGAIITDITESPIVPFILKRQGTLSEWWRQLGGIIDWDGDAKAYAGRLSASGHKVWHIESAIGFSGFIIGKEVGQAEPNKAPEGTRLLVTDRAPSSTRSAPSNRAPQLER